MAPPTAYMLFCNENRETIRQKLVAEGHEKIAVTLIAKELGQLWKSLSDEEKAAYKAKADEQLQLFRQQQQSEGAEGGAEGQSGDQNAVTGGEDAKAAALPSSWIRRVVVLDPEVRRCSADALQALSAAADVFIGAMCTKATGVAAGAKRRTVRIDDIERCVRTDKRLVAAGFTAVMAMVNAAAAAAVDEGKGAPPGKKPRLDRGPAAAVALGAQNMRIERAFGLA